MWVSGGVFHFKEMEKPYSESQKDLVPHSARCSSEAKNVYFHIHQPNLNNSTMNTELHRSVTALLIFRTIYSFRCSCFNCSPVFTSDVEKVRSREGEGWLLVTQWVDKQKAIFSSSPWTRAQWPRQRWTHPGPSFALCCSSVRRRAAYQDIHSHYILSMELQSLNDSFPPCHSFVSAYGDVFRCACAASVIISYSNSQYWRAHWTLKKTDFLYDIVWGFILILVCS